MTTKKTTASAPLGRSPIAELAWCGEPWNRLFALDKAGRLWACCYERNEGVVAWSRLRLGGAFQGGPPVVESIRRVKDENEIDRLCVAVKRTIGGATRRTIERLSLDFEHDRLLADVFAVAIGVRRGGRVIFGIGAPVVAGENLVAADVDDCRADVRRCDGDIARAETVDADRLVGFVRAAINIRPGGGVDDEIGFHARDECLCCLPIGDVEFRHICRDEVMLRAERVNEARSEATERACDQDAQDYTPP